MAVAGNNEQLSTTEGPGIALVVTLGCWLGPACSEAIPKAVTASWGVWSMAAWALHGILGRGMLR